MSPAREWLDTTLADASAPPSHVKVKVKVSHDDDAHRPLVLIVDDDPDTRFLYAHLLEARGFRTVTAEDGEAGVELSVAAKPDVVLMDGALPGLSGFEAAARIRGDVRTASTPIVMLTGFARSAPSSARSADAYLTKPSSAEDIADTLRSVLGVGWRGRGIELPPRTTSPSAASNRTGGRE